MKHTMDHSPSEKQIQAAAEFAKLMPEEGARSAPIPGVTLWRVDRAVPRVPVLYEPCIVFVLQGSKRGFLKDRSFVYGPNTYLVLVAPLPFECETSASPDSPLYCLYVRLQGKLIAELLEGISFERLPPAGTCPTVQAIPMDPEMADAVYRLVRALRSTEEARMLGPLFIREIMYRALQGPGGSALRAGVGFGSHFARICQTLQRLHREYDRKLTVRELARQCGMSSSAFHEHFKLVTSTTPAQYLKAV